ncbi:MAG TPA: DUF2752 domain-containing protein [Tepidisphaeraceae bacterium]
MSASRRLRVMMQRPVLAPLLAHRRMPMILAAVGLLTLALGWLQIQWFPCPLRNVLGITCPGCGLTRGCVLLLKGQWADAIHVHAFSPLFLLLIASLVAIAAFSPSRRRFMSRRLARVERATAALPLLLMGMILYWLIRSI